jgi:hypothetical protein
MESRPSEDRVSKGRIVMSDVVVRTPMQYLDKANGALRDLGLLPAKVEEAPINALLERISDLEPDKIAVIAKTLGQTSVFNEVVREQTSAMSIGQRYQEIAKAFDSIRDDAKTMVDQLDDGKIDFFERVNNVWMKVSRGDIGDRFGKIRSTFLDVTTATKDQIQREAKILEAYRDYRGALKQAEVLALQVLKSADAKLEAAKAALGDASNAVANFAGTEPAERAKLELVRDEHLRRVQDEDKRYQIAKDLSDNLTISYNTSEVIMARLMQTTNAKERVYQQSVSFFSTNDSVLTALRASFTGLFGLHESTAALDTMKEGVSKSIEILADMGAKVQEAAVRSGYGPTIRADAVKKLVDSVVNFQERSLSIAAEMRDMATKNSAEIRDAVEAGNQRIARLVTEGKALGLDG